MLKSNPEHSYQTTVNKSGFISFLNNKLSLTSSPPYDYISYIDIHKDTFIKRFNPQTELSLLDGNWINLTKTKISSFNSKGYKFRVGDIFKRNNAIYTLVELTSIIKKHLTLSTNKSPLYTLCNNSNLSLNKSNHLLLKNESLYLPNSNNTFNSKINHKNTNRILVVPKNNSCVQRQRKVNIQSKFASGKSPLVQCRQCKHYEAITSSSIIAPCECEGKLKYIHIDCLKNLFTAHTEVKKEKDWTKIIFPDIICEYCKNVIQKRFRYNNIFFSFVDFIRPTKSNRYLIFEKKILKKLNEKNEYIIIDMNNRDSIDIKDSITINYNEDGHFYLLTKLYDIYSFLQGDIMFIPNLSFTIENSKMILTFEMKLKKLKWLCCYKNKTLSRLNYYDSFSMQRMLMYMKEMNELKNINTYQYDEEYEKANGNDIIVIENEETNSKNQSSSALNEFSLKQTESD